MATPVNVLYEFGPFQLDPPERLLMCDGKPVSLPPKAFDLLLALVERSGHLVEKDELLKIVWPGSFVEEGNLAVTVSLLRKALNDNRGHHRYIETVSKKGYRFVAEVKRHDDSELVIAGINGAQEPTTQMALPSLDFVYSPALAQRPKKNWFAFLLLAGLGVSLLALVALGFTIRKVRAKQSPGNPVISSLAVLPFQTLGINSSDK